MTGHDGTGARWLARLWSQSTPVAVPFIKLGIVLWAFFEATAISILELTGLARGRRYRHEYVGHPDFFSEGLARQKEALFETDARKRSAREQRLAQAVVTSNSSALAQRQGWSGDKHAGQRLDVNAPINLVGACVRRSRVARPFRYIAIAFTGPPIASKKEAPWAPSGTEAYP